MRRVIIPPADEVLDLAAARKHLKLEDDETDEDDLIQELIVAAREQAEFELGRPLLPQTCVVTHERLAAPLRLWSDVTAVTSVSYVDAQGEPQTLAPASYRLVGEKELRPVSGAWPVGRAVHVEFECGAFADPEVVPRVIRSWMKLLLAALFVRREAISSVQTSALPGRFVAGLLDRYRVEEL